MNVLLQALEHQGLVVRRTRAPVGPALPTELTARGAAGVPVLASPLASQLVDRVRRRPLLIAANAAAGATVLALLMVHSRAELWGMYAVAIFYGAASAITGPAGSALLRPDRTCCLAAGWLSAR